VRVSKGRFSPAQYGEVKQLLEASSVPLVPALRALRGLLYYHVAADPVTNTMVNVSVWESLEDAKQMDTLQAMLAQRAVFEQGGVAFDAIANYEPLWKIEGAWSFHGK
jgi:hypothetical protein